MFSLAITIITVLIYYDYIVTFKGFDFTIERSTYNIVPEPPQLDKNNFLDDTYKVIDELSLIMNSDIYYKSNITNSTLNNARIINSTIINSVISNTSIYNSTIINATFKNSFVYNMDGINIQVSNSMHGIEPDHFTCYDKKKVYTCPLKNDTALNSNLTTQNSTQD